MKLILATSKTCGPCMVIKSKLKASNLSVEIVEHDPSNPEPTKEFFTKHGIRSVPRLVVLDDNDNASEIIQGIDEIVTKIKDNVKD